ncbi:MAG: acylphosphatase [Candidatus Gottesmanbacteria bacterium]|nr:acylphosphatase [Candidatus Gottesmanbacteria bacterium]
MKRVHLIISGDVQGVGYRAWVDQASLGKTRDKQEKSITGWVKNREDGAVEVVAEGEKKDLEDLIGACHKGPEVAFVEKIQVEWEKATGEFMGFEVVY